MSQKNDINNVEIQERIFCFREAKLDEEMDEVSEFITEGNYTDIFYSAALIFEEVFLNISTHAYAHKPNLLASCLIKIKKDKNKIEMSFVDYGIPFDPTHFDYANYNAEEGGKGIEILSKYSKKISYKRFADANILNVIL